MKIDFNENELRLIRKSIFGQMCSMEDRNLEKTDDYHVLETLYEMVVDAITDTKKGE